MSKRDRQGARTPADLERKYGLRGMGKSFSAVLGASESASASAARVRADLVGLKKSSLKEISRMRIAMDAMAADIVKRVLPIGIVIALSGERNPNILYPGTVWECADIEADPASWTRIE